MQSNIGNELNITEGFLNEFFLQLFLAEDKKKRKLIARKIPEKRPEELEKMPLIRRFTKPPEIEVQKPSIMEPKPEEVSKLASPKLEKIKKLIEDPAISTLECSGANQNIIIKKNNNIIDTKEALTEQEIKEIIADISTEAGVSLSPAFKASLKGFTMNAVLSEFIGSSFIITRHKIGGETEIKTAQAVTSPVS